MGINVYSPIAHTHSIGVWGDLDLKDHVMWLQLDEEMMCVASTLIVARMAGWDESDGIKQEVAFFERNGKPIYDFYPDSFAMIERKRKKPLREHYENVPDEELQARTNLYLND